MIPSPMPGDFIYFFFIGGCKASGLSATLPIIMRLFAKLILLIYGLSIAGYVLLDATHEVLHQFKNNLHHAHNHDNHHHSHSHHHVEDHHVTSGGSGQKADTNIVIYYFHLFFQRIAAHTFPLSIERSWQQAVELSFENPVFPPHTPPPMRAIHT